MKRVDVIDPREVDSIDSSKSLPRWAQALIGVGAGLLLLLVLAIIYFIIRKRRENSMGKMIQSAEQAEPLVGATLLSNTGAGGVGLHTAVAPSTRTQPTLIHGDI